jgi:PAP2 superfamily
MVQRTAFALQLLGILCILFGLYSIFAKIIPVTILFMSMGLWLAYEGRMMKHRLLSALSTVALISLTLSFLLSAAFSVVFYWPDFQSISFAWKHYLGPVTPALLVLAVPLLRSGGLWSFQALGYFYSQAFAFIVIIFLHFNFKLWAQLINPLRLDDFYQRIDILFSPVIAVFEYVRAIFAELPDLLKHPYHEVFVGMFIVSFAVHALRGQKEILFRLMTTIATVLVLGGLSYSIAPAWGPFLFASSPDPVTAEIQRDMAAFQETFNRSGGATYDASKFIAPLAAMPSLHLAHAFVFLLFGLRHVKLLGYTYLPCFIFLTTEAVVGKWHYLIDLPAGIGIAFLSLGISNWLNSRELKNPRESNPLHVPLFIRRRHANPEHDISEDSRPPNEHQNEKQGAP